MKEKASSLPDVMRKTSQQLAVHLQRLATGVAEGINQNGNGPTATEIAAALHMIGQLAGPLGTILEKSGEIFSGNGEPRQDLTEAAIDKPGQIEISKHPKTFSELLAQKIDKELLPPDKTEFTRENMLQLTRGFPMPHDAYLPEIASRQQVITTLAAHLGYYKARKSSEEKLIEKNRSFFMRHFHANASQLDIWAQEINYSWEINPAADEIEAAALIGLSRLNSLLEKRTKT